MRAAIAERYGGPEVIRVGETQRPSPRADEVLVRVESVAVTSGDARIRGARFPAGFGLFARLAFGILRPRRGILGSSFSGEVEALGQRVRDFAPGDEVCGMTGARMGAHAGYVAVPARKIARKPASVTHDQAAGLLFGGTTALFFLRDKASVAPGMSVLVNGASGAIGTNAVQLAKHFGATVTAVTSAANAGLAADLGADRVIDYRSTDLMSVQDRFDVVLDTVGNVTMASGRCLLSADGVLLLAVAGLGDTVRARGNVVAGPAPENVEAFEFLLHLVAEGKLSVVIENHYALDEIGEAHRRVDSGRKVGNIIVRP